MSCPGCKSRPPWDDVCPVCMEKAVAWCHCEERRRKCPNGHAWKYVDDLRVIINKEKIAPTYYDKDGNAV